MKNTAQIQKITASALLIAVGIVIPMFFPKVSIPPASFTLASHVPVFLAMFISPAVAAAVALGTTLGFTLSGLPLIIALRAATHLVFALVGAFYLKRFSQTLASLPKSQVFSFFIALLHAAGEVVVVTLFYFGGSVEGNYVTSVVLLVGVGTVVHSMVDFAISLVIMRALSQQKNLRAMFAGGAYLPTTK